MGSCVNIPQKNHPKQINICTPNTLVSSQQFPQNSSENLPPRKSHARLPLRRYRHLTSIVSDGTSQPSGTYNLISPPKTDRTLFRRGQSPLLASTAFSETRLDTQRNIPDDYPLKVQSVVSTALQSVNYQKKEYSIFTEPKSLLKFLSEPGNDNASSGQQIIVIGNKEKVLTQQVRVKLRTFAYCLIQDKVYAKKSNLNRCSYVRSPNNGETKLYCAKGCIKDTMYLVLGMPADNIRFVGMVGDSYAYVTSDFENHQDYDPEAQNQNAEEFLLEFCIKAECKRCSTKIKREQCTAWMELDLCCESCGNDEDFHIKSWNTNGAPLWHNGKRIREGEKIVYQRGSMLRVLGCNECWSYRDLNRGSTLQCGCHRCEDCSRNSNYKSSSHNGCIFCLSL